MDQPYHTIVCIFVECLTMVKRLLLTSSQLKTRTCLPNRPPRAFTDSVFPVPAGPYGFPPMPMCIPVKESKYKCQWNGIVAPIHPYSASRALQSGFVYTASDKSLWHNPTGRGYLLKRKGSVNTSPSTSKVLRGEHYTNRQ